MDSIVAEIVKIIKDSKDAISREECIWRYFTDKLSQSVAEALEIIDAEVAEKYKQKGYEIARRDWRTIQCIFGAVRFKRRLLKKSTKKSIYPMDQELGLVPYQRYTPYFQYCVAQIAAKSVYRSTALAVNLLTPVEMSHQKVGSIVKHVGKKYALWEKEQAAAEPAADAKLKEAAVLYIEGDGVMIRGQGQKKREIHRFQIAEGVETCGNRRQLTGTHCFAGFNRAETAKQMKLYLENNYDLSNTTVLSNSDGGSGYGKSVFDELVDGCCRHEHFRDRYHVNKKIKERLNFLEGTLINKLQRHLWDYDWDGVSTVLDTAESIAQEKTTQEEQVQRLRGYLKRNWNYLNPIEKRGLGAHQKGLGTCESNHRLYSYRMKRQSRRWGKEGGEGMLKIITGLKNEELARALTQQDQSFQKKQSRQFNGAVRIALRKANAALLHIGVQHGRLANYSPSSSAMGKMVKIFA